jgi:hypothetical protein
MEGRQLVREDATSNLVPAAVAGLAAAVAGGVAWGLIVRWTDYEIGFAAWAIGFLVGIAVLFGARGARGMHLQVLAVVLALVGILIGKYLAFVWVVRDAASSANVQVDAPIFSGNTWSAFMDSKSDVWSFFDVLWIGLAVVSAFRIPGVHAPERDTAPAGGTNVE